MGGEAGDLHLRQQHVRFESPSGLASVLLADTFGWPAAVRWLSPFLHLGDVPAGAWNAPGAVGMLAVAVVLAVAGCRRYARRDLRG